MYMLQIQNAQTESKWKDAERRGSIGELKDFANLQNTNYRIVDDAGTVQWEFFANPESGVSR